MTSIKFKNQNLFYLDQRKLPAKEKWLCCRSLDDAFSAIKQLRVRGAPLIGVFAAYAVFIASKSFPEEKAKFLSAAATAIRRLKSSRPTAVNLFWALKRIEKIIEKNKNRGVARIKECILSEAKKIHSQDIALCRRMASFGLELVKRGDKILTHCNTGFLATSGEGTALSVIFKANRAYRDIEVYADETRPLLQGSRLTAWELAKEKVNYRLICDNMAAWLMAKGKINKVFLGADRIAANGDAANKIGTYSVAVLAKYHKIPFYMVAPFSSFDLSIAAGTGIKIEERNPQEVRQILGNYIAPKKAKVANPAFDVTPNKLISAIVSDKGIIYPPFKKNIKKILSRC